MQGRLVNYGVFQEHSDVRAHVCTSANKVYVFRTKEVQQVVKSGKYRLIDVNTGNVITARGWLVPPFDIPDCVEVDIPPEYRNYISEKDTQNEKGIKAEEIVRNLFRSGRVAVPYDLDVVTDKETQMSGVDFTISANIQVKCDMRGGRRESGGTGNLFIQHSERRIK